MKKRDNEELLSDIIVGRVKPHIYAFTTNTIPNYIKVGDTYRPVKTRLREWMRYFPDLHKVFEDLAMIDDDTFFRDYSVHQYLETDLSKHRLEPNDYPDLYYSNEFFKDVRIEQVASAIKDIRENYEKNTGKYKYYDATSQLPETYTYASTGEWEIRPNQQDTIDRFKSAVKAGRKNLLMYAVMRFGKSFTSLCCAKEMKAKLVLVVSAKADVLEEWKKTVQRADNFNKDYVFLSGDKLANDQSIVKVTLAGGKRVVVFLTLQDLQGENIKDKHQEIFGQQIDLLIVDETHFGARAESYGKVIRTVNYEKDVKEKHADDDFIEIEEAEEQIKSLSVNVTLHLSGTPYRILMGSEFEKDDIIAFYQFSDIVKAQEEWNQEHLDAKEWENPYYGFPQMIRFAFVPSKSALALLERLRSNGTTYAFSELLKPRSICKDSEKSLHRRFVYEKEVLELFEAIDGSKEDEGLLSFLDYDEIKGGEMCQHIVCVLPYCASCDALEALLVDNYDKFKNLQEYTILNISGVDSPKEFRSVRAIQAKIKQLASKKKKTITLTVNRMLTGSTVEEWDTMIFLKDTASPQEYDQAIFRLQNQYIIDYVEDDGDTIKFNMKPQTILVDFDPHRMFVMQEQKSQIYNVNTDASGNEHLRERLEEELRISPIITINKNRIEKVEATDILAEISAYSNSRGVLEETKEIPVDMSLLKFDAIKSQIDSQAELGSRQGLTIDAHKGEESNLDNPDDDSFDGGDNHKQKNSTASSQTNSDEADELKVLENKFRTYYSRILFFAFLTPNKVASLEDVIQCMCDAENDRIAKNLNIERNILSLIKQHINIFILQKLDYKIQNINALSRDESMKPLMRAYVAIKKFGRISDSEVTTQEETASDMIDLIPDECFVNLQNNSNVRVLDIASKMGEFAIAIVNRCEKLGIPVDKIKNKILSIPTSSIAYEFTRKVYEILELDVSAIAEQFNSYDLLKIRCSQEKGKENNELDYPKICSYLSQDKSFNSISLINPPETFEEEKNRMKFSAIVGNPPYQEPDGGAGASAEALYPYFVDIARKLATSYVSIIIPTRWFTGGKHLDAFRKSMIEDIHIKELHDCLHPEEIFPDTNNRGGICYFLWDRDYDNSSPTKMKVVTHNGKDEIIESVRSMKTRDLDLFIRNSNALSILDKVIPVGTTETMSKFISSRKPFGIESNIIKSTDWHTEKKGMSDPIVCYGKRMQLGYIERDLISSNKSLINKWKVYTPRANNIGTELNDDNLNTFLGEPGTVCTEAYIVIGGNLELNQNSAENLMKYFNTKFARFMHSLAKSSHDASKITYRFVPVVDFSEEWGDEKLYEKFGLTQDEIDLIERSIKPMM